MKYLLLVAFVLFFFCGSRATAQIEFAPLGAEWYYGSIGFNHVHYSHLKVEKDTVLNGVNCRKIVGTFVPKDGDNSMDPLYMYNNEDTVFFYNPCCPRKKHPYP